MKLASLCLFVVLGCGSAFSQTFVQQTSPVSNGNCNPTSATSGTCALPSAPTNGNVIYGAFGEGATGGTVSSVVQTGVTWTKLVGSDVNRDAEIWCGTVGSSPSATATVSYSGSSTNLGMWMAEFSGATCTGNGTSSNDAPTGTNSATPGNVTTTNTATVGINFCYRSSGTTLGSGPSGWTAGNTSDSTRWTPYYIINSATGSFNPTISWTVTTALWDDVQAFLNGGALTSSPASISNGAKISNGAILAN
jgi:hypothetical protein